MDKIYSGLINDNGIHKGILYSKKSEREKYYWIHYGNTKTDIEYRDGVWKAEGLDQDMCRQIGYMLEAHELDN